MKDQAFLMWLHERMVHVHGESEIIAHQHKLRAIIAAYDPEKVSYTVATGNSLAELVKIHGLKKELSS